MTKTLHAALLAEEPRSNLILSTIFPRGTVARNDVVRWPHLFDRLQSGEERA